MDINSYSKQDFEACFLNNNIRIYKQIYFIENWLRRICHIAYLSVFKEGAIKNIPISIRENIKKRKEMNKKLSYVTSSSLPSNDIWMSTIAELKDMMTFKPIWERYLAKRFDVRKDVFESKLGELEAIRNVISHGNLFNNKVAPHFESTYKFFKDLIDDFKNYLLGNPGEEGYPFFDKGFQKFKRELSKPEKEDYLSYVIYNKAEANKVSDKTPPFYAVDRSKEDIVTWVETPFWTPNFDYILKTINNTSLMKYLFLIVFQFILEDVSRERPGPTIYKKDFLPLLGFIFSKDFSEDKNSQNIIIDLLFSKQFFLKYEEITDTYSPEGDFVSHPLIWYQGECIDSLEKYM